MALVVQRRGLSLWARLTGQGSSSALTTKGGMGPMHVAKSAPQTARGLYKEIMRYKNYYPLGEEYFKKNVRFLFRKYGDVKEPVCCHGGLPHDLEKSPAAILSRVYCVCRS